MDETQARILNMLQIGIPICDRPFAKIADQCFCSEDDIVSFLQLSLKNGSLTRFGPMYNISALSGSVILAAMSVKQSDFDSVTSCINSFSEVAHNYERDHKLNMWFVIAEQSQKEIDLVIEKIQTITGYHIYSFHKKAEFCLDFHIYFSSNNPSVKKRNMLTDKNKRISLYTQSYNPSEIEWLVIENSQAGIPVAENPFQVFANKIHLSQNDVLGIFNSLCSAGIIRRIAAIPNHYHFGVHANAMTVWEIPQSDVSIIGDTFSQLNFVTHCYERSGDCNFWPYNIFAMIHGSSHHEMKEKYIYMQTLAKSMYKTSDFLLSKRILKKNGLRFKRPNLLS